MRRKGVERNTDKKRKTHTSSCLFLNKHETHVLYGYGHIHVIAGKITIGGTTIGKGTTIPFHSNPMYGILSFKVVDRIKPLNKKKIKIYMQNNSFEHFTGKLEAQLTVAGLGAIIVLDSTKVSQREHDLWLPYYKKMNGITVKVRQSTSTVWIFQDVLSELLSNSTIPVIPPYFRSFIKPLRKESSYILLSDNQLYHYQSSVINQFIEKFGKVVVLTNEMAFEQKHKSLVQNCVLQQIILDKRHLTGQLEPTEIVWNGLNMVQHPSVMIESIVKGWHHWRRHYSKDTPLLFILAPVKTSDQYQWMKECIRWIKPTEIIGNDKFPFDNATLNHPDMDSFHFSSALPPKAPKNIQFTRIKNLCFSNRKPSLSRIASLRHPTIQPLALKQVLFSFEEKFNPKLLLYRLQSTRVTICQLKSLKTNQIHVRFGLPNRSLKILGQGDIVAVDREKCHLMSTVTVVPPVQLIVHESLQYFHPSNIYQYPPIQEDEDFGLQLENTCFASVCGEQTAIAPPTPAWAAELQVRGELKTSEELLTYSKIKGYQSNHVT